MPSDHLNETVIVSNTTGNTTANLSSAVRFVLPTWSIIIHVTIIALIIAVAIVGNSLIILVQHATRKKTSTDILVTCMAVCDVTLVIFNIPVMALSYGGSWTRFGSDTLCNIIGYVESTLMYCSSLLLTLTALDRYFKTCLPHENKLPPRKTLHICIGMAIASLLIWLCVIGSSHYDADVTCAYIPRLSMALHIWFMCLEGSCFLMFAIVAVAYVKVGLVIRRRARGRQQAGPAVSHVNTQPKSAVPCTSRSASKTATTTVEKPNQPVPIPGAIRTKAQNERSRINKVDTLTKLVPITGTIASKSQKKSFNSNKVVPLLINVAPARVEVEYLHRNQTGAYKHLSGRNTCTQSHDTVKEIEQLFEVQSKLTPSLRTSPNANATQNGQQSTQVNRTTRIMFAISLVFILSFIPAGVAFRIWPSQKGETVVENILILWCRRFHFVNSISNPLFYIMMSSKFRQTANDVLIKRWSALKNRSTIN